MSHGTMKYTLKAHVYYFVFMAWLLHYLYSISGKSRHTTDHARQVRR
jgi:hypothetical protein